MTPGLNTMFLKSVYWIMVFLFTTVMSSKGRDFILGFMGNYEENCDAYLLITSDQPANVTVDAPFIQMNSTYQTNDGYLRVGLVSMHHDTVGKGSKCISIRANIDISVYAVSDCHYAPESVMVIPVTNLGKRYIVGMFPSQHNNEVESSEILIVAGNKGTFIQITFRSSGPVSLDGKNYTHGDAYSFELSECDTFLIKSIYDLTGTEILSDKPISVFAGNQCVFGKYGAACDHIAEQIPPVPSLSTNFVMTPFFSNAVTFITTAKLVAAYENTEIYIQGKRTYVLNAGEYVEREILNPEYINASKAILLLEMAEMKNGGSIDADGDPSMIVLPSVSQFSNNYTFSLPIGVNAFGKHHIVVTVEADYQHGILLDGVNATAEYSYYVSDPDRLTNFSVLVYEVSGLGRHRLQHRSADVKFGAVLYGAGEHKSYGHPLGMELQIAAPNTTNPVNTTISPTSSAMRSTSITTVMVPTTQPPPSYMSDPAPNTTNPASTTISANSRSTASTSSSIRSTSITTVMVPNTQPTPSYMPDPAPNATNPASTTISANSRSTASTSSSIRSTSITTVMVPNTQPPPSYMPDPGEHELQLQFDLKVEMEYNDSYADKTSSEFQSLATNFSVSLIEVFKNLKGFKSIDILRFRRGSVIVDYLVNVFATVDVATVIEDIGTNIVNNLTSIAGVPINIAYTHKSMTNRLDNLKTKDKCSLASATLCPFGYYCKPATTSIMLCIDRCNSTVCQNNGECYVGHHLQDVQCRCTFSETAVYSGKRCETKHEVMTKQERNTYLIIACSVIGGILLVCLSMVCVINRKRKRLKKRFTRSHILNLDEMRRTSNNGTPALDDRYIISMNPAFKRYPEEFFDGRSHAYHQHQGLDDGYMQMQENRDRYNSDPNYDYIHPR